ncbi:MAG: cyclase family protein [Actinobacteria bacterium]|nr:cyclase family protein [Actinomycetota bacterium]
MARFVELSHPISEGMPTFHGFPPPVIGAILTREESGPRYDGRAEFLIGRVDMPGNTGTYLDSPFHRHPHGPDLSSLPLERIAAVPGVVLDGDVAAEHGPVDLDADPGELRGRAVLVRTGWDSRWGTDGYVPGPHLSPAALDALLEGEPALVGVDFLNVDDPADLSRPAHTRLLAAGTPILENMANLGALPRDGFELTAVPAPIVGGASFPVRAFARIPG